VLSDYSALGRALSEHVRVAGPWDFSTSLRRASSEPRPVSGFGTDYCGDAETNNDSVS
jgi:hypothetical protein